MARVIPLNLAFVMFLYCSRERSAFQYASSIQGEAKYLTPSETLTVQGQGRPITNQTAGGPCTASDAHFETAVVASFLSTVARGREIRSAVATGAGLRGYSSHGFDQDRSGGLKREIGERGYDVDLIHRYVASAKDNVRPARYRPAVHRLGVRGISRLTSSLKGVERLPNCPKQRPLRTPRYSERVEGNTVYQGIRYIAVLAATPTSALAFSAVLIALLGMNSMSSSRTETS